MKTYSPKKPSGSGALWTWRRWIWDLLAGGLFPIAGDGNIVVQWIQGVYRISVKPAPGGGGAGGWPWMYPSHIEGDRTQFYKKGFCMYLSALNPLVVTGMTDLVSNANVTSCQGVWLAMQDIPVAGGGKWNVPQFPYPTNPGTVAPSGTPLKGDLDNPALYWYYLGDITS